MNNEVENMEKAQGAQSAERSVSGQNIVPDQQVVAEAAKDSDQIDESVQCKDNGQEVVSDQQVVAEIAKDSLQIDKYVKDNNADHNITTDQQAVAEDAKESDQTEESVKDKDVDSEQDADSDRYVEDDEYESEEELDPEDQEDDWDPIPEDKYRYRIPPRGCLWALEGDHAPHCERMKGKGEFHKFMKLPQEIRRMIWKHALPGDRVARICVDEDEAALYEGAPPVILNYGCFDMPLAYVCHESRNFIIEFGYFLLWEDRRFVWDDEDQDWHGGPWWHHRRDSIEYIPGVLIDACLGLDDRGIWRGTGMWIHESDAPSDRVSDRFPGPGALSAAIDPWG